MEDMSGNKCIPLILVSRVLHLISVCGLFTGSLVFFNHWSARWSLRSIEMCTLKKISGTLAGGSEVLHLVV
jgi:hypothetical protein